jgi:integrase
VRYRWHDLRHTFVSRLAESPHISEETIRALAGHVSQSMLTRYSHIRTQAKRLAIAPWKGRILPMMGHEIGHNLPMARSQNSLTS